MAKNSNKGRKKKTGKSVFKSRKTPKCYCSNLLQNKLRHKQLMGRCSTRGTLSSFKEDTVFHYEPGHHVQLAQASVYQQILPLFFPVSAFLVRRSRMSFPLGVGVGGGSLSTSLHKIPPRSPRLSSFGLRLPARHFVNVAPRGTQMAEESI